MTRQLKDGDILLIHGRSGAVTGRLIYRGDGLADSERLMQGFSGLSKDDSKDYYKLDKSKQKLTEAQIAAWLARI